MVSGWASLTSLRVLDYETVTKLGWAWLATARELPLQVVTDDGEEFADELESLQSSMSGRKTLEICDW